jgi:Tol biopolymer transport system component
VAHLADDLWRHLEERPVSARRGSLRYRAAKFLHRHALSAGGSTTVGRREPTRATLTLTCWSAIATLTLGAVATGYVRLPPSITPFATIDTVRITRLTAAAGVEGAAISPDGKYAVYASATSRGHTLQRLHLASRNEQELVGPSATVYDSVAFAPDSNDIYYRARSRHESWDGSLYRVPLGGGAPRLFLDGVGGTPTFSPSGDKLAFVRVSRPGKYELVIARSDGLGQRVAAVNNEGEYFSREGPAWSPDGSSIAVAVGDATRRMTIVLVKVADGRQERLTEQTWENIGTLVWLLDGSALIMDARDAWERPHQLWRVALADGQGERLTHDLGNYAGVSAAADGGMLLTVERDRVANVWAGRADNLSEATEVTGGMSGRHGVFGLAWTPDNRLLYTSTMSDSVDMWIAAPDGGEATRLTERRGTNAFPAVAAGGRSMFFVFESGGRRNVWTMEIDGTGRRALTAGHHDIYPDVTPDGRWIVYQVGGYHRLWKVSADGAHRAPLTHARAARPRVSPDGRLVACNLWDPDRKRWRVALLSFESGRLIETLDDIPSSPWTILRWTPDGRGLTYVDSRTDDHNLWISPIDGGAPRQLTRFTTGHTHDFAWSHDGRYLAWSRGPRTQDLVLVTAR